jgi:hypothetical protein
VRDSVTEWLWFIQRECPGAGITPFNVYDLPAYWWAYYVHAAQQHLEAMKEANRG